MPALLPRPIRGRVAFEDVTFRYPARPEQSALFGISFDVSPGETVALVGPSGAGKTTVFQLLLRFYDPQAGDVRLDGVDVASAGPGGVAAQYRACAAGPGDLRRQCLGEHPLRPAGRDRCRGAGGGATPQRRISSMSCRRATTRSWAKRACGCPAASASASPSRAPSCATPPILLLDEATSALDAESEQAVQHALAVLAADRTTLVVAHRLATVRRADRIVVIDKRPRGRHRHA